MNGLVVYIWAALVLDLLIGDPRFSWHPVRIIGRTAMALEGPARTLLRSPRLAGIVVALLVIGGTGLATAGILNVAARVSPILEGILSVVMLYTAFAARDLADHSNAVLAALETGDIDSARQRVARIVGRDTEGLDEPAIVRATVESVAENTVDGIIAPLSFAFLFGPVGAMVYKAVSTLDSTFGYKNEKYRYFGWASARIDDIAAYLPARISAVFLAGAAILLRERPFGAVHSMLRDSGKHESPNAGIPESGFAGALGVQLGGPVSRRGRIDAMPLFGDPLFPLGREHIRKANRLMYGSAFIAAATYTLVRICIVRGLN
ncbi:MAG: cobalamin biosynthesis protein CobD [Spirochaetes bacterium RBG_16_49_21]|nr:MAG: cobalamin biosynthesis protein CobD [Spirochaetes bacterium RBG_16_49_21]